MENLQNNEKKTKFSIKGLGAKARGWLTKTAGAPMKTHEKVIGVILIVVFLFAFYVTLDANKFPALVRVIEGEGRVGVNPTADALDFGDLSRGTSAVRKVDIENGTPIPMYIAIVKTGKIGELMKIDNNYFTLAPRDKAKIEFTVYMPASAEIDSQYKGRVYLFKIPTFGITR
ncbi:MAG: hypothetical protein AAB602_01830 [Patescibacteria group bacterium]|mgnify:FL=1